MASIASGNFHLDPSLFYVQAPTPQAPGCPSCDVSNGSNNVYVTGAPYHAAQHHQHVPQVVYMPAPVAPAPAQHEHEHRYYREECAAVPQPQLIYVQQPPAAPVAAPVVIEKIVEKIVDRPVAAPQKTMKIDVTRGILRIDDFVIDLPVEVMNNAEFREKFSEMLFMKMNTDCNAANAVQAIVRRMQNLDPQGIKLAGNKLTVGNETVDITDAPAFGNLNGAIQKIYDVMKGFKFDPDNGDLIITNLPCGEEKRIKFGDRSLVGSNSGNSIAYKHGSVTDAGIDISKMDFAIELFGRMTKVENRVTLVEGRVDKLEKDLDAASFEPKTGELTIGKKVLLVDAQSLTADANKVVSARGGSVDISAMPQQVQQDTRLKALEDANIIPLAEPKTLPAELLGEVTPGGKEARYPLKFGTSEGFRGSAKVSGVPNIAATVISYTTTEAGFYYVKAAYSGDVLTKALGNDIINTILAIAGLQDTYSLITLFGSPAGTTYKFIAKMNLSDIFYFPAGAVVGAAVGTTSNPGNFPDGVTLNGSVSLTVQPVSARNIAINGV